MREEAFQKALAIIRLEALENPEFNHNRTDFTQLEATLETKFSDTEKKALRQAGKVFSFGARYGATGKTLLRMQAKFHNFSDPTKPSGSGVEPCETSPSRKVQGILPDFVARGTDPVLADRILEEALDDEFDDS